MTQYFTNLYKTFTSTSEASSIGVAPDAFKNSQWTAFKLEAAYTLLETLDSIEFVPNNGPSNQKRLLVNGAPETWMEVMNTIKNLKNTEFIGPATGAGMSGKGGGDLEEESVPPPVTMTAIDKAVDEFSADNFEDPTDYYSPPTLEEMEIKPGQEEGESSDSEDSGSSACSCSDCARGDCSSLSSSSSSSLEEVDFTEGGTPLETDWNADISPSGNIAESSLKRYGLKKE